MGRRVQPKRFFIFKFGLSPSENFFFFNESHSKMVNYAFNFILKALFVLEIFKFLP